MNDNVLISLSTLFDDNAGRVRNRIRDIRNTESSLKNLQDRLEELLKEQSKIKEAFVKLGYDLSILNKMEEEYDDQNTDS